MTNAVVCDDVHAVAHRMLRRNGDHGAAHNLGNGCVLGRFALQNYLAGIITLRQDAKQPTVLHHKQRANLLVSHHFDGFVDGGVRRCGPHLRAFLLQNYIDFRSQIAHWDLGHRIVPPPFRHGQISKKRAASQRQYHTSMQTFDALLREAEVAHGHLCAGQILGVRMAMLGCERLGIDDPKGADRKRLVTFIEIDRCATDAIGVVTGCRLGKRAIKFRDWGKMAATFVDLSAPLAPQGDTPVYKAVRVAALESSKQRARDLYPHIEQKNQQQMLAYREMPDTDLFSEQWVSVPIHPREMPGYKSARITCEACGEGINYDREVRHMQDGIVRTLCQGCAAPETRYYKPLKIEDLATNSKAGAETSPQPACEHC